MGFFQPSFHSQRRTFNMSRYLNLLLLFCFTDSSGNTSRSVTGKKGSNVTLPCEFEDRDILDIVLNRQSKIILLCENEECGSQNDRVFKEGSCDVIIKDLIFSDAGKYFLRVYYTDEQRELKYHLHIHDEISVETGEQLKMDVLLINADKVERNSSGEWTEVWTRGHGVSSDRLTDHDETLIINEFTVSDTGTYRVLDSEGEILITVTVTESSTGSKGKLDTDENTEQHKSWIIVVCVTGAVLLVLVIPALIWKHKRQNRNGELEAVPME